MNGNFFFYIAPWSTLACDRETGAITDGKHELLICHCFFFNDDAIISVFGLFDGLWNDGYEDYGYGFFEDQFFEN